MTVTQLNSYTHPVDVLTDAAARTLIDAAVAKADSLHKPMAIAIADLGGNLQAFHRMDGAPLFCVDLAIDKAYTAASFGLPTDKWHDHIKSDPPLADGMPHRPRLVIFGGGVPIKVGNVVVGSIGVSGGHYSQDVEVAQAAISSLTRSGQTPEANKVVVRRLFSIFNGADVDGFRELVTSDFLNHEAKDQPDANRKPGPDGIINVVRWIRTAFSDLHYEELVMLAEDDLVATRVHATGRHTGPYRGRAGEGRAYARTQAHFFRLDGGLIAEHWAVRDDLGSFIQLGFIDADLRRPE